MASRRSSPAVTTLAIFHFIAGALGLLWSLCRLVDVFVLLQGGMVTNGPPGDPGAMSANLVQNAPGFVGVQVAYTAVGLVFDVLLIVAGIGLLNRQAWARYASIGYGALSLLIKLFLIIYTIAVIGPAAQTFAAQEAQRLNTPADRQAYQTGVKVGLYGLSALYGLLMVYPAIVILVLLLPSVARTFDRDAREDSDEEGSHRGRWRDRDDRDDYRRDRWGEDEYDRRGRDRDDRRRLDRDEDDDRNYGRFRRDR